MTTITGETSARSAATTTTAPAEPSPAGARARTVLELDLVSSEFLQVSLHGPLTADRRQELVERLADLLACGTQELRLSLANVPLIAPSIARVLVETAEALRRCGRALRLTEVPLCLGTRTAELIEPGYRSALLGRMAAATAS